MRNMPVAIGSFDAEHGQTAMNDVTTPTAGFYKMRMVRGGAPAGVRIFYGPPIDPLTGEEMDRSLRWQAEVNGIIDELERVWPGCMREPIDAAEYRFMCDASAHARDTDARNPMGQPRKRVEWDSATPPLF